MKRRLAILGFGAGLLGLAGAIVVIKAQPAADPAARVLAGGRFDAGALPVVVPYRDMAGAIAIDVVFGEDGEAAPMILDTGAPTAISRRLARGLGSLPAGSTGLTSADGNLMRAEVTSLKQLAIGSLRLEDVGAVVLDLEEGDPLACLSPVGFLGSNLMRHAVWQIDPQTRTITIAGSVDGLDHVAGAVGLPLTAASEDAPSPIVGLELGDSSQPFLLDSGFQGWLAVNPDDAAAAGFAVLDDAPAMAVRSVSAAGPSDTRVLWISSGDEADALLLATTDALPRGRGLAGTDYLRRFVVTLDWPNDVVYLKPVAPLVPSAPSSASLAWDDGFVLGSFVDGMPEHDDLSVGQSIARIDGRDVSGASFEEFCHHMLAPPETFSFTLAGDEERLIEVAPVTGFFEPLRASTPAASRGS